MSAAREVVVDASVAVKWALDEDGSDWARTLAADTPRLIAPHLLYAECANAVWRIARRASEAAPFDADEAFDAICSGPVSILATGPGTHVQALRLAVAMRHPACDCLYLALALERCAALATADARFARALRRAGALPDDRLLTPPAPPP